MTKRPVEPAPLWYNLAVAALFIGVPLAVVAGLGYIGGVPAHDLESTGTGTMHVPEQAAAMSKYFLWTVIGLGLSAYGLVGLALRLVLGGIRKP